MDTLNNDPWWWEEAAPAVQPERPVQPDCDVVIVGAGFAGLSAAITLARAGRSVQVFDADDPGRGASSRNGGMASGNLKWSLDAMIKRFGIDKARAFYAEGRDARDDLAGFIRDENIDCDFAMTGRFTGAMTRRHFDALQRESDALNKHVDIDAWIVNRDAVRSEIGSDLYCGGIVRPDIGGLHPGKLHAGILRVALDAGIPVHGRTAVTDIQKTSSGFSVTTDHITVSTRDVIVATNGYTDARLPWLQRRVIPIASQIIATEELAPDTMSRLFPKKRMHGETRRLFHYYRPSPDGTRILFGGRAQGNLNRPQELARKLHSRLVGVFPELDDVRVTHSWWGYVGFTFDFLPHLHIHDGVRYATGFNGSGVVWARWLGKKAALEILGDDEATSAFRSGQFPTRPLYQGKTWFLPAAIAWENTRDRFDQMSDRAK